jgi:hypothetical protein
VIQSLFMTCLARAFSWLSGALPPVVGGILLKRAAVIPVCHLHRPASRMPDLTARDCYPWQHSPHGMNGRDYASLRWYPNRVDVTATCRNPADHAALRLLIAAVSDMQAALPGRFQPGTSPVGSDERSRRGGTLALIILHPGKAGPLRPAARSFADEHCVRASRPSGMAAAEVFQPAIRKALQSPHARRMGLT